MSLQTKRKRVIERNLRKALLEDGPFVMAHFEYELEEYIDEYLDSKHQDGDAYFLAITERTDDVAMLLIDEKDRVLVNENGRAKLKALWRTAYKGNIERLIPDMAREIDNGHLYVAGVKVQDAN